MNAKILKVKSENNSSVTFTLKSNAFNIFEEPENNLWTFDLEGRLVGMFIKGENYRRTLDNTFHLKTRQEIDRETFRNVENIEKTKIIPILEKAYNLINNHINDLPDIYQPVTRIGTIPA